MGLGEVPPEYIEDYDHWWEDQHHYIVDQPKPFHISSDTGTSEPPILIREVQPENVPIVDSSTLGSNSRGRSAIEEDLLDLKLVYAEAVKREQEAINVKMNCEIRLKIYNEDTNACLTF